MQEYIHMPAYWVAHTHTHIGKQAHIRTSTKGAVAHSV